MEYLFSRFTDENKVQGDQVSGSEVIEPLGDGLEFELLIDRAGSYSNPTLSPLHPTSRVQGVVCSRQDKEALGQKY